MREIAGIILFFMLVLMYIPQLKAGEIDPVDIVKFRQQLKNVNSAQEVQKAHIQTFSDRYMVSPGDTLNISVLGEQELEQEKILVKYDGYINVHPVGEIKVAGFNVDEVKTILAAQLSKYFIDPIVSVHVNSIHIPKIYIHGAVQKPGLYQHYKDGEISEAGNYMPPTLAGVIADAGGIKYSADLENIQVVNRRTGKKRTYNLLNLIKNGDSSQDIYLSSGDTVFIPARQNIWLSDSDFLLISSSSIAPEDFPVKVVGAVKKPGVHFLTTKSPGINTAIAASEGFRLSAKTEAVKIHRVTNSGAVSTIVIDPSVQDIVLRPNDTINVYDKRKGVSSKIYRFFLSLVGAAGRAAGPLVALD